ncbi:phosphotransferase family protein [Guptibacillus algicola]|uniref:phosphotransferase family protein n=1 Tax=Guptibacillus algicola TaxID=225844 RepID=UPI001CD4D288|nr:aminoglycoside phosphotransferase family protein [Alkalihalobacillus algicola]MCA0988510.1 aminoglycoside phosphotransferase family protein [Alkalihalobacillus algicola]
MEAYYKDQINTVYPELNITSIKQNTIGQNNDVVIVNESLVFRFPKYEEGIEALRKETDVLNHVRKHVSLPIPSPTYQSFDPYEAGKVFAGYEMIEGEPLWRENFHRFTKEEDKERIARQLVTFLTELHATSSGDQSSEDIHREVEDLYVRIQKKLFSYMRQDAKWEVSNLFESFLRNEKHAGVNKKRIHGDFGASNILWDPERYEITGIIDFGETEIGDSAYDFAGLFASYGENFIRRCLSLYPDGQDILERVMFYKETFALQEALHGIEHNDARAFENGIREYR